MLDGHVRRAADSRRGPDVLPQPIVNITFLTQRPNSSGLNELSVKTIDCAGAAAAAHRDPSASRSPSVSYQSELYWCPEPVQSPAKLTLRCTLTRTHSHYNTQEAQFYQCCVQGPGAARTGEPHLTHDTRMEKLKHKRSHIKRVLYENLYSLNA